VNITRARIREVADDKRAILLLLNSHRQMRLEGESDGWVKSDGIED